MGKEKDNPIKPKKEYTFPGEDKGYIFEEC